MKTQLKTTWMSFLTFGISTFILIMLNSCDKGEVDYMLTTNFVYKNLTLEPVELNLFDNKKNNFKNYSIPVSSEIKISLKQTGGKTGVGMPFGFENNYATSIIIKFNTSNKCLIDYPKITNVKSYDNFSESMYNTSNNTLIYNIDSEEFDIATTCL